MGDQAAADIQRRMTFMSMLLGVMVGLGLVMIAVATYQRSVSVLIVLLPLVVTAIPVLRAIKQSRVALRTLQSLPDIAGVVRKE
jgi:Flp pilus assembly protein TadB